MAQTKDFFVSYTSSDREWAEWVAWELQEAGYTCTIQAWHFAPSQNFIQRMRQALVETRHLVAILSDESTLRAQGTRSQHDFISARCTCEAAYQALVAIDGAGEIKPPRLKRGHQPDNPSR